MFRIKTHNNKNLWLAVNQDNTFVIFTQKPTKTKLYEIVESKDEFEFTPYGDMPKYVPGDRYEECWATTNYSGDTVLGIPIHPSYLATNIQEMTWNDNPIQLI